MPNIYQTFIRHNSIDLRTDQKPLGRIFPLPAENWPSLLGLKLCNRKFGRFFAGSTENNVRSDGKIQPSGTVDSYSALLQSFRQSIGLLGYTTSLPKPQKRSFELTIHCYTKFRYIHLPMNVPSNRWSSRSWLVGN